MSQIPTLAEIEEILSGFGRALHPRELASRLDVHPNDYPELIAQLDRLEGEGALKVLPGGRVRWITRRKTGRPSSTPREETWEGEISVHPKGFGFVTAPGHDDVFIPPDAVYEALHRDRVKVRITGKSRKGYEGCVVEVVKRNTTRVAGVISKKKKSAWLDPDDTRIRGPILLAAGLENANDGDAAVVDIIRYPQFSDELAEGQVVEVLGPQGDPQTEVRKILVREGVSEVHSPEALQNAEQMAQRLKATRLGKRRDLRNVPLPTIDPEDARDHDDALWVERTKTGYLAYIAIADVSEYVRAESPLDEEARGRGCTIYLPDRAIPMLPRALAGDLCSLLPDEDRFCLCVIAELDKHGQPKKFEIVEGLMRSCAKLTYAGVARALGLDEESPQSPQAEAMKDDLRVLEEVAGKLRKNRMERGALDLDLPEARVVLDEETGSPVEVKKRATRPGLKHAYSLVEEMMLLANELVARWLDEKGAPAIYRVHGKPDEEKLERLALIIKDLNLKISVEDLSDPLGASKFLRRIQNHERKPVLEMLLLRSLQQAVYDTNNIGHFGLASERYVHFTSPIRRYPDLRVHRQIKHILRGGKIDKSDEAKDDLSAAASESSKRERAAMEVEREVLNLYRAVYMKGHIGDEMTGRISGMSGSGLYVTIEDPCVDVMIPFDDLGPDEYETDELELGVIGTRSGERLMMGDSITVIITDAAVLRRTVYAKRLVNEGDYDFPADRAVPERKTFRNSSPGGRSTASGGRSRRSFKPERREASKESKTTARAKSSRSPGATTASGGKGRSSSTKKAGARASQARKATSKGRAKTTRRR